MLIDRHDMGSGLQEYVSIWTLFDSFWIFPETVSVADKWVDTDLMKNRFFYLNTTTGNNSSTDVPLLR